MAFDKKLTGRIRGMVVAIVCTRVPVPLATVAPQRRRRALRVVVALVRAAFRDIHDLLAAAVAGLQLLRVDNGVSGMVVALVRIAAFVLVLTGRRIQRVHNRGRSMVVALVRPCPLIA